MCSRTSRSRSATPPSGASPPPAEREARPKRSRYVDQGYTGTDPAAAGAPHGIQLEAVKHTEAKRGFVLLSRRWVAERTFAWAARFRRLARDFERLAATLAADHYLAFACLMLPHPLAGLHNRLGVGRCRRTCASDVVLYVEAKGGRYVQMSGHSKAIGRRRPWLRLFRPQEVLLERTTAE